MAGSFIDTSAWVALVAADDVNHDVVATHLRQLRAERTPLLTSSYVIDETATALRNLCGLVVALRFLVHTDEAAAQQRLRIIWPEPRTHEGAWRVLQQHRGVPLSFTDAVTAVLARAQRVDEVLTLDAKFKALGLITAPDAT